MPTDEEKVLAELREYQTEDYVLQEMLTAMWNIIEQSEIAAELEYEIVIGNLAQASRALQKSHYATSNSKVLLPERLIIVDERFLIETEAAIRSFEIAGPLESCPYLRSDEDLFGLTDRITTNPYKSVARLRGMTSRAPEKEQAIRHTVALTYLFFIGHELGQ